MQKDLAWHLGAAIPLLLSHGPTLDVKGCYRVTNAGSEKPTHASATVVDSDVHLV
jgi:hypothetical protein